MPQYIYTDTISQFAFHLMDSTEYYKDVPVRYSYDYQPSESSSMYYPGCDESISITLAELDGEYKDDYSVNEKRAIREYLDGDGFKEQVYEWMQEAREKAMLY